MLVQYAIIQQILVLAIVVELCLARFFFHRTQTIFFFRELNLDFRAKDRVSAGEVEGERGNHE